MSHVDRSRGLQALLAIPSLGGILALALLIAAFVVLGGHSAQRIRSDGSEREGESERS